MATRDMEQARDPNAALPLTRPGITASAIAVLAVALGLNPLVALRQP